MRADSSKRLTVSSGINVRLASGDPNGRLQDRLLHPRATELGRAYPFQGEGTKVWSREGFRTLDRLSQRFAEVRIPRSYLDAVHGARRRQWKYWPGIDDDRMAGHGFGAA